MSGMTIKTIIYFCDCGEHIEGPMGEVLHHVAAHYASARTLIADLVSLSRRWHDADRNTTDVHAVQLDDVLSRNGVTPNV